VIDSPRDTGSTRSGTRIVAGAADDPVDAPRVFRDESESRDASVLDVLPAAVDWAQSGVVGPARDQGESGSCVSHAACAAAESRRQVANLSPVQFAPRTLHLCLMGLEFPLSSSRFVLLETLRAHGMAVDSGADAAMTERAHCAASGQIPRLALSQFFDLRDADAGKLEIATHGPVVCHMLAREDFFHDYLGTFDVYRANPQSPLVGKHAVCIVGYDDAAACWIGINSLGAHWGRQGLFRIAYDDTLSRIFTGLPAYCLDTA
jgi:hypothetical protein